MAQKLTAAQRRYIENALLIAALRLTFKKLEEDYEIKPLGEIADTTSGGTPLRNMSTYYGGNIPWIKSGELNDNLIEIAEEYITEEGLANSSAKIYPKGTLVVALYGATVGKTGILGLEAASNQAVCAIFPRTQQITNEFIFWFLRHKRPEFLGSSFGGAQPNISQKIIRETQIPIPSLELQKKLSDFFTTIEKRQSGDTSKNYPTLPNEFSVVIRTVMLIESLAAQVNKAQRLRKEADEETGAFLDTAVGKVFSELKAIETKPLKELATKIGSGSTPTGGRASYLSSGIPFIRSMNVRMRRFQWEEIAYIDEGTHEAMSGTKVKPKDVLLNITGASIGRVACAPDELVQANVNQHVTIIRPVQTLDNKFLMYRLSQTATQDVINDEQKGATRQGFTKAQIEQFQIPIIPLDEQRRIVASLDGLQAKVNALRELQTNSGEELSALMPSILDKAFKGEL